MSSAIKTTFLVITIVIGVGLLITNMVFSFYYIRYEFDNEKIISYIHETLESKFIYSFIPRTKCLDGEEKLVLGQWDGTLKKCQCNGITKDLPCGKGDKDCETVEGEKPIDYTVFGGKEICVVRKGESYYNLVQIEKIIAKDKNCSETQKFCGIVDTFERKLCVNKDEDCPLNKSSMDKVFEETPLKSFISKINFDKNNLINFLNEENDDNKIISIIKLSDGYPCLNISEKNWKSYHPAEKYKNLYCSKINGQTLDYKYQKFENFRTKKVDLYRDNNLSKYITTYLEEDDTIINLYGTNFLGLDVGENGFNYAKILSIQDLSNSCGNAMRVISYIIIAAIAIPGCCFGGAASGGGSGGGDLSGLAICFGVIIGVVSCVGFVGYFIICIIIYVSIQRVVWFLKGALNIGDETTKILINELIEKYSSNYTYALTIIILLALFVCSVLITICIYKCNKYR